MTPFVDVFQQLTNTVWALVGPLYSPYRQQVLQAETKLAAAVAPYARQLADSALGGCLVQVEAALVADTGR